MRLSQSPSSSSRRHESAPKLSKIVNLISAIAMMISLALAPQKASAEGPQVELEGAVSTGIPFSPKCPNPFQNPDGTVKLVKQVKYDSHGHVMGTADSDCVDRHSKYKLSLSYIWAPELEGHEDEAELEEPEGEQEEHGGHPEHRLKAQVGFVLIQDKLELSPKIEFALEKPQFGVGATIGWHPKSFHELAATTLVRASSHGIESYEGGVSYTIALYRQISVGAGFLAEGHGSEVHWGVGPEIQFSFGSFAIAADMAWAPEGVHGIAHYHITLIYDIEGKADHLH